MGSYGGPGGGRTRMGTKVFLNVYDLAPANDYLYPIGLGLHHSGVEILGAEYSFASGAGIFDGPPQQAPGARFREQVDMGAFDGGSKELQRALDELRDSFGPDDYNLIRKNCNSFANALCWKLLRRTIPGHVNRLADVGVCCSCLLPKKLLEEAPVGDPNRAQPGFRVSGGGARVTAPTVQAFTGSGARLGSNEPSSNNNSSSSNWQWTTKSTTNSSKGPEDLTDRREKARKAALARLEKNQTETKLNQD